MGRKPRASKRTKRSISARLIVRKRKLANESNNKTRPESLTGETIEEKLFHNLLGATVSYYACTI